MENSEIKPVEQLRFSAMKVDVRPSDTKEGQMIQVEKALKILKRKMEKDDILRTIKERRYYQKPSEKAREYAKRLRKNRKR